MFKYIKIGLCGAVLSGAMFMINQDSVSADSNNGQYQMKQGWAYVVSHGRNDGVWTKPYGQDNAQYLGSINSLEGRGITVYGTYIDADTGTKWIQFDFNGQKAWVVSDSVRNNNKYLYYTTDEYNATTSVNKYARNNTTGNLVLVTSTFYDQNGVKWANIGDNQYVENSSLDYNVNATNVTVHWTDDSYGVTIKSNVSGDVWTRPYGLEKSEWMNSVSNISGNHYTVDKVASFNNQNWIHLKNTGWVHESVVNWDQGLSWKADTAYGRYGIRNYVEGPRSAFNYFYNKESGITKTLMGVDGTENLNSWYY